MISFGTALTGIAVLVLAALGNEWRSKRGKGRPLAARFAASRPKPELGMEATDSAFANGVLQRNTALAAKTGAAGSSSTWTAAGAIPPSAIQGDERVDSR